MKRAAWVVVAIGLVTPGLAMAAVDCGSLPAAGTAPRASVLAPLATELVAPSYMLGANSGVLGHAYDESQTVDEVLLRRRIEGCRNVAIATPASVANPNDPGAYKPQTEFDNTPWRFDMNQNGRRMTADEFDAWMKARGVRVARGSAPAAVPAVAPGAPGAEAPAAAEAAAPTAQPAPAPTSDDGERR
ncbi:MULTISPECIES: hypothetical protein [unclassified Luteimonas]|uniref:hypothetical protein n=1 Tax=unclassified Luteimonas TaxID=2629088 RepID=UPI001F460ED6|nr:MULTISPECIES: hypothetical protein [unclassified Luteimonas]